MNILIIDNYDSFTYNLVQYVQEQGAEVVVAKNDEITLEDIKAMDIAGIILSPGPGTPLNQDDVGICTDIIKKASLPILGVCLGHQLIGHLHGGSIAYTEPKHGEKSTIHKMGSSKLFKNIPDTFDGMRYHSLIVERENIPTEFTITAETEDGMIMAFEHNTKPLYGMQFHPESIGTPCGKEIIGNFLKICQPQ